MKEMEISKSVLNILILFCHSPRSRSPEVTKILSLDPNHLIRIWINPTLDEMHRGPLISVPKQTGQSGSKFCLFFSELVCIYQMKYLLITLFCTFLNFQNISYSTK